MQKKTLHQGNFIKLTQNGKGEYAQRSNATGCVGILAITELKEVLLVEQFRVPINADTIELTAGLIGDEVEFIDESIAQCANRELIEETGYSSENMVHLLTSPSSAGLTDETVHLFYADKLTKIGEGGGVENENITVHKIPLGKLQQWSEEKIAEGKVIDAKIFSCLYLATQRGLI